MMDDPYEFIRTASEVNEDSEKMKNKIKKHLKYKNLRNG
jgi:hypothetical protein